jgi:hypothetical protein
LRHPLVTVRDRRRVLFMARCRKPRTDRRDPFVRALRPSRRLVTPLKTEQVRFWVRAHPAVSGSANRAREAVWRRSRTSSQHGAADQDSASVKGCDTPMTSSFRELLQQARYGTNREPPTIGAHP